MADACDCVWLSVLVCICVCVCVCMCEWKRVYAVCLYIFCTFVYDYRNFICRSVRLYVARTHTLTHSCNEFCLLILDRPFFRSCRLATLHNQHMCVCVYMRSIFTTVQKYKIHMYRFEWCTNTRKHTLHGTYTQSRIPRYGISTHKTLNGRQRERERET